MSARDDGGPAFPIAGFINPDGSVDWPENGMTLPDYFAGKALAGIATDHGDCGPAEEWGWDNLARAAYLAADAMLAAREAGR